MTEPLLLAAPLAGWALPIEETPDPVFAARMLGDGLAIDPVAGELRAPCAGRIVGLHACRHAVTLRAENGVEILMHVGLETVSCGGEGFEALVAAGDRVGAGDLLLRFDLDLIARRAASLVSPIVVVGGAAHVVEGAVTGREVVLGEPVLTVRPLTPRASNGPAAPADRRLRRRVRVALAHGLHARPAALVAREAAQFAAEIGVEARGRIASARSPVSVMALAVTMGEEVELAAAGDDAAEALEALARLLGQGGESPAPSTASEAAPRPEATPSSLVGVPAAPGLAIGPALRLVDAEPAVDAITGPADVERAALAEALAAAEAALAARADVAASHGREIAEAHLALLGDHELRRAAFAAVAAGASAGVAWSRAVGGFEEQLRGVGDTHLAERAADLADLRRQVLRRLSGGARSPLALPDNAIVVADDLLPSQLMELDPGRLAGVAVARGGPTSHVAIIARAMDIPAVVALGPAVLDAPDGGLVILDGDEGRLRMAPGSAEIAAAEARLSERRDRRARAAAVAGEPARMADGTRIEVFANLATPAEAAAAVASGAEGCGLLRTEFLFMDREVAPSEDEQLAAYQAVADALAGRPFVIRTLDAGADKPVPYLLLPAQENPALGLRGVRAGLAFPELLRAQLRAILRVRPAGQARVMLPMVSSLAEVRAARGHLAGLAAELGAAVPPLGIMVETPAAAITADLLAAEADFLSIGSNDLAQYALAMDRASPELAAEIDAMHPAVLRLIGEAARGGARRGRRVAVCGALASEVAAAPILIGLGVTELSAATAAIPELKAAIRELTMDECRSLAERVLSLASAAEVRALTPPRPAIAAKLGAAP